MLFVPTTVKQALDSILARKLNTIRCCVTGAPYATISTEEIQMALESEHLTNRSISVERLIDTWELRALTLNTNMLPSLRGVKETALVPHIVRGHAGQVRVLTYMLTRLFYPQIGGDFDSDYMRKRMLFSIGLHDAAESWKPETVVQYVQHLVAIDSFCNMAYWHKMSALNSHMSQVGLHTAPVAVQKAFATPTLVLADIERVQKVIAYLFTVMLYAAARDSNAGLGGNKQAQLLMVTDVAGIPTRGIPLHQVREVSQADIDRMAKDRAINANRSAKVAWSATYGKGVAAGTHVHKPTLQQAKKPMTPFEKAFDNAFARFAASAPTFNSAPTLATTIKKG